MIEALFPQDEASRLAALHEYDVLDSEPEQDFDDLTKLASILCAAPICLVSLIDTHRQWFKSRQGLEATETSRDIAFCSHAILDPANVLIIPDAALDERFHDNPLVTSAPNIRFYAGAPLINPQGHNLGTLCVIDHVPRQLSADQILALRVLSHQVVTLLELRRKCRDLAVARATAEAATAAKSRFLAYMSHEIRTPMNALLGMTELLEDTALTSEQREYLSIFSGAGQSLLGLVNDMLDLSRVEADRLDLRQEPIPLQRFLESTLELLEVSAQQKGLTLALHLSQGVPEVVVGDTARIRQVLLNLIGNAIKFTAKGGVELRIGPVLGDAAGTLELCVADTGIGISAEAQRQLFRPFAQVDSSAGGGTGLGLHLSRRLVERMGGALILQSEEGVGSRFVVRLSLPRHTDSSLSPRQPTATRASDPEIPPLRILLTDDSEDNRLVIQHFLRSGAHHIDTAETGEEALAKFQGRSYDIVLMDVHLPGMDGYATTQAMRRWEADCSRAPTPILALTAYAMAADRQRALQAGCDDHLPKPIFRRSLLEALHRHVRPAASRPPPEDSVAVLQPRYLRVRRSEVATLRTAVQNSDLPTLGRLGHSMSGSGSTYGLPEISQIGATLETASHAGDLATASQAVEDLDHFLSSLPGASAAGPSGLQPGQDQQLDSTEE